MEQGQNKPDEIFSCTRIAEFQNYLHQEERSRNTITKYIGIWKCFLLSRRTADGQRGAAGLEKHLTQTHAPASVNSIWRPSTNFWTGSNFRAWK